MCKKVIAPIVLMLTACAHSSDAQYPAQGCGLSSSWRYLPNTPEVASKLLTSLTKQDSQYLLSYPPTFRWFVSETNTYSLCAQVGKSMDACSVAVKEFRNESGIWLNDPELFSIVCTTR